MTGETTMSLAVAGRKR